MLNEFYLFIGCVASESELKICTRFSFTIKHLHANEFYLLIGCGKWKWNENLSAFSTIQPFHSDPIVYTVIWSYEIFLFSQTTTKWTVNLFLLLLIFSNCKIFYFIFFNILFFFYKRRLYIRSIGYSCHCCQWQMT